MSVGTLLTVLSLFVAAYAIAPRYRRLELPLRVKAFDAILLAFLFLLINLLSFTSFFNTYLADGGLTAETSSYALVLIIGPVLYYRFTRFRLGRGQVGKFCELAHALLDAGQYHDLLLLLSRHVKQLGKIHSGSDWATTTVRQLEGRLAPPPTEEEMREFTERISAMARQEPSREAEACGKTKTRRFCGGQILRAVYACKELLSSSKNETAAREKIAHFFERCFSSPPFVETLAREKPYMALDLFDMDRFLLERFLDLYFDALFGDVNSVLYFELAHSESDAPKDDTRICRYTLDPGNKLIYALFRDVKVAERLEVWRPVGDRMLSTLTELSHDPVRDQYLRSAEEFDNDSLVSLELFAGLHFFDIMVSAALYQGAPYHMWLRNVAFMAEGACKNIQSRYPTGHRYDVARDLYQVFLRRCVDLPVSWVRALNTLSEANPNGAPPVDPYAPDQTTVVNSAIDCIVWVLNTVLPEDALCDKCKSEILDRVLSLYMDLRRNRCDKHALYLLESVWRPPVAPDKYRTSLGLTAATLEYGYDRNANDTSFFDDFVNGVDRSSSRPA